MTDGLKDKHREAMIDILSANERVDRVVLFGSRAMGTFTPTSDVDIVLYGPELTPTDRLQLAAAIEELSMPQQVDLLLHKSIKKRELIEHIEKHGVEWWRRPQAMGGDSITFQEAAKLVRQGVNPEDVGDMPYIGLEHIEEGTLRLIGIGNAQSVTSTKFKFSKGDILFGKLRPYFRKVIRPDFDGVCSTDIWVVRAKQGIDQGYLYYWMASNDFVNFSTQGSEGTKMPRAKWEHVGRFKRQRLEEFEQRAIAHILGSLDDKIELNRRMNKTLEAMARTIFKSWFVDFDPVHAKAEGRPTGLPDDIAALFPDSFEDSELGEIPKGWEVKSLDQIATYLNGLACQKYPPEKDKESLPVIKIRELHQGITDNTDRATTTVPTDYIVKDGDVLFSWSGSLMIDIWTQGKGILNQHLFKIT
jgi:type I restriction enzyme S subunit